MEDVVKWATILSPIIAVLIAWWMGRSSRKATAKQIAALEESTTKQIESIKELARLQIELSTIQIGKELAEVRARWRETSKKSWDVIDDRFANLGFSNDVITKLQDRREKQNSLSYEQEFYEKQMNNLEGYLKRMDVIKQKLDKM